MSGAVSRARVSRALAVVAILCLVLGAWWWQAWRGARLLPAEDIERPGQGAGQDRLAELRESIRRTALDRDLELAAVPRAPAVGLEPLSAFLEARYRSLEREHLAELRGRRSAEAAGTRDERRPARSSFPPDLRIARLRASIQADIDARRWERARVRARELIALSPGDPQALAWIEEIEAAAAESVPEVEEQRPLAPVRPSSGRGFFVETKRAELHIAVNADGIDGGFREFDDVATGGVGNNFARYRLKADLYLGYALNLGPIKEVYFYVPLEAMFGDNTPGTKASLSARPIAARKSYGLGVTLPRGWRVFAKTGWRWHRFDSDSRGDGPGGLHNFVHIWSPDLEWETESGSFQLAGYGVFAFSWPRNEYELNRRPTFDWPETGDFGEDFSRYFTFGELRGHYRVDWWRFEDVFGIWFPEFHFGRTIPQREYTWEWDYIGARKQFGGGVTFKRGWRLYVVTNSWTFSNDEATGSPDGKYLMVALRLRDFEWGPRAAR